MNGILGVSRSFGDIQHKLRDCNIPSACDEEADVKQLKSLLHQQVICQPDVSY